MMARPAAKPALPKAPTREHPAAPPPASTSPQLLGLDVASSSLSADALPVTPPVGLPKRERGRPRKETPTPAKPRPKRAPSPLTMFSARIDPAVARRAKLYAVNTDCNLQTLTEAALTDYMNRNPAPVQKTAL